MQKIPRAYLLSALLGLTLATVFFYPNVVTEFIPFFIIAPLFILLKPLSSKQSYRVGLIFFGAWLIPTSLWYFNFMPWWQALLSLTYFTLMANIFSIPKWLRVKSLFWSSITIAIFWLGVTSFRIHLPLLEGWWIPHLAYTQWQNLSILQIANIFSIEGIIALILLSNIILATLWSKNYRVGATLFIVLFISSTLLGNYKIEQLSNKSRTKWNLIAIQMSPLGGYHADANATDIEELKSLSIKALSKLERKERNTFILWPENMIAQEQTSTLKKFAKKHHIYLIFNRKEATKTKPYNTVIILNPKGKEILKNYKTHSAPAEGISVKDIHNWVKIDGVKVTSDICYDLHFSNLSKRAKSSSILFAPVDDDRFGSFMPYLHARDVIFRAIENRISILSASTNGPSMYVDSYGVIKYGPLKVYKKGYLIVK